MSSVPLPGNFTLQVSMGCLALHFFTLSHNWHNLWENVFEHKMCGLIFSTTFIREVSNSENNSVRYSPKKIGLNDTDIHSKYSEQVGSLKYLVSTVSEDNSTEEKIKDRIALGNKTYYANQKILQRKLVLKKVKLK